MIVRKEFKLPIYGLCYEVAFVTTLDEAKEVTPEAKEYWRSFVWWKDDTDSDIKAVFRIDVTDEKDYAHECVHLADRVCVCIGHVPDTENNEPYACLVGHLMSTVMEVRREYDFRMKLEKFKEGAKDD